MFNFEPFNSNELHCNYIEFDAKINDYIVYNNMCIVISIVF